MGLAGLRVIGGRGASGLFDKPKVTTFLEGLLENVNIYNSSYLVFDLKTSNVIYPRQCYDVERRDILRIEHF